MSEPPFDANAELLNLAESAVRRALTADVDESQHLDWDFVFDAYEALVALARRGSYAIAPSVQATDLLSRATSALHLALHGSPSTFDEGELAGMEETLRALQRWHGHDGCSCPRPEVESG